MILDQVISNFRDAELLSQNKETVAVKVLRDAKV